MAKKLTGLSQSSSPSTLSVVPLREMANIYTSIWALFSSGCRIVASILRAALSSHMSGGRLLACPRLPVSGALWTGQQNASGRVAPAATCEVERPQRPRRQSLVPIHQRGANVSFMVPTVSLDPCRECRQPLHYRRWACKPDRLFRVESTSSPLREADILSGFTEL